MPFHPSFSLLESLFGNLLGSWRLFGFSQNHKDWGIHRDHHTIFQSKFCDSPHIFPRAKAVLRRVEGEFHFALPLRLLGAVLLVPPLLGSGEVLAVPVPPVCCLWKTVSSLWVLVTLVANAFQSGSLWGVLTIGQ